MSLRRAEAIVHPRDSCDLDGRLSGSLASFKFAIGVRFKKDRSDSFRKDLAPRPILLFGGLNNQVQHLFWQGVAMGTDYEHLTAEERATLMVRRADGFSQRAVALCLGRSPSTISRELARNASCCKPVGDTIAVIPY